VGWSRWRACWRRAAASADRRRSGAHGEASRGMRGVRYWYLLSAGRGFSNPLIEVGATLLPPSPPRVWTPFQPILPKECCISLGRGGAIRFGDHVVGTVCFGTLFCERKLCDYGDGPRDGHPAVTTGRRAIDSIHGDNPAQYKREGTPIGIRFRKWQWQRDCCHPALCNGLEVVDPCPRGRRPDGRGRGTPHATAAARPPLGHKLRFDLFGKFR